MSCLLSCIAVQLEKYIEQFFQKTAKWSLLLKFNFQRLMITFGSYIVNASVLYYQFTLQKLKNNKYLLIYKLVLGVILPYNT